MYTVVSPYRFPSVQFQVLVYIYSVQRQFSSMKDTMAEWERSTVEIVRAMVRILMGLLD